MAEETEIMKDFLGQIQEITLNKKKKKKWTLETETVLKQK